MYFNSIQFKLKKKKKNLYCLHECMYVLLSPDILQVGAVKRLNQPHTANCSGPKASVIASLALDCFSGRK